jgi:hypothetical protein
MRWQPAGCLLLIALRLGSQTPNLRAIMFLDQNTDSDGRLFGLDIVDWSMLFVAIVLTALIVVLA